MSFFNNFLIVKEDRTQLCLQVSWLDAIISWLKVPDFTSVSRSNAPGDMLLSHFELVLKFRVATPLSPICTSEVSAEVSFVHLAYR